MLIFIVKVIEIEIITSIELEVLPSVGVLQKPTNVTLAGLADLQLQRLSKKNMKISLVFNMLHLVVEMCNESCV